MFFSVFDRKQNNQNKIPKRKTKRNLIFYYYRTKIRWLLLLYYNWKLFLLFSYKWNKEIERKKSYLKIGQKSEFLFNLYNVFCNIV